MTHALIFRKMGDGRIDISDANSSYLGTITPRSEEEAPAYCPCGTEVFSAADVHAIADKLDEMEAGT